MLSFPKNIDSFLLRSSLGPYIKRDNPTAFAMGFSYLSAAEFIRWLRGPRKSLIFGERKNDGALISIHRNPLAKSLLTRGILERPKGNWNSRRLLEQSRRLYLERSSPNKGS